MMMEPSNEQFRMFHRYNKLVRRKLVKPLVCTCGNEYVTGLGKDDELVLKCHSCGTQVTPGANTVANVRAVVREHFEND